MKLGILLLLSVCAFGQTQISYRSQVAQKPISNGSGAPSNPCPYIGNLYNRTDNSTQYYCPSTGGTWTLVTGSVTGGSCANQAVTAINSSGVPTCTTLTSSYVNNTIALTGTDINTSNQVTATHLASALPVNQGGSGTSSTLTGIMRGGSPMTASELSGDATTSGSNAVTVVKVNGAVVPTSSPVLASNGSNQFIAATTTGSGTTVPLSTSPTFTTDIRTPLVLGGTAAGSTITLNGTNNGSPSAAYMKLQTNGQFTQIGSTATPVALLSVSGNTSTPTSANSSTALFTGADAANTRLSTLSAGTGVNSKFAAISSRGTIASPTATQTGDIIASFEGIGYGATGYGPSAGGAVMAAGENWTDSAQGSLFQVFTTPNGSTTATLKFQINGTGNFTLINGKGQHFNTQAANNDLTGTCTFSGTTCTITFTTAYNSAPACTASDQTAAAPVRANPSTTQLVLTGGTGAGATDVAAYICHGNPN